MACPTNGAGRGLTEMPSTLADPYQNVAPTTANPTPQAKGAVTPSNPTPPPASSAASTDWTSDPIYQLATGQDELAVKNAQAAALASQTQALIAYGDSSLALAVTGDPQIAAAAAANKASTLAQLVAQNAKTVRDTNEAENQNNLWYSSDRGYQLGLAQQTYLNNSANALSNVQGQLGSIGANLLAQENSAYADERQAASEAYGRSVANPPGIPDTPTPPPAAGKTNLTGGAIPPVAKNTPAPKTYTAPYTASVLANKTGASANQKQGIFSVH